MTAESRNNPHRDRLPDVKRVPDREHDISHVKHVTAPEFNRWEIAAVNLKKREVGFRIRTDKLC